MCDEAFAEALAWFPCVPGNQVVRAHLLARRGTVARGTGWLVHCSGDDLTAAGDPGNDPAARSALPPADWSGFGAADPAWEGLFAAHFREALPAARVGWLGRAVNEEPARPVRPLGPDDLPALLELGEDWLWKYYPDAESFLREGGAWGALEEGVVRGVASVFAADERYADIGVATHPESRGRGLGRAAVLGLLGGVLRRGFIPFWETSADNLPSRRIPERWGWEPVSLPPLWHLNRPAV